MNNCPTPSLSFAPVVTRSRAADPLVVLPDDRLVVVAPGEAGVAIHCLGGDAWITQAGFPDDFVVAAGDTFITPRPGKIVVQAVGQARIRIENLADPLALHARPVVIPANHSVAPPGIGFPAAGDLI